MRKLLQEYEEDLVKNRVYIAKVTSIFSYKDISSGFGISKGTLYRTAKPEYRELSRSYSQQTQKLDKCYSCSLSLVGHKRCRDCTILLHSKETRCESCIDTHTRLIVAAI